MTRTLALPFAVLVGLRHVMWSPLFFFNGGFKRHYHVMQVEGRSLLCCASMRLRGCHLTPVAHVYVGGNGSESLARECLLSPPILVGEV